MTGVQNFADSRLSVAIAAAFRTFLNPELADKAHHAFLLELQVPNGHKSQTQLPTSAQAPISLTPTEAAANGNGNGKVNGKAKPSKRKREVNPDRKPRNISLFNLFQVKVMRMLKDSGEYEKQSGRLSAGAQMWSSADQSLKDVLKSHYEPLMLKLNESKQLGGAKLDLHHELEEHEKQHPLPPAIVDTFAQLLSKSVPVSPAPPATAKKTAQIETAVPFSIAPMDLAEATAPAVPSHEVNGAEVDAAHEAKKEKKKKKKAKDQSVIEDAVETESAKKKKKKKSKDGDAAAQTPAVESSKKKKKTPAKEIV